MTEREVALLLCDACGLEAPPAPDEELLESGLLDSLALIELLAALEDAGWQIHPTRVERSCFASVRSICALLNRIKTAGGNEA
ncbi:MAG: hypothetical protein IK080_03595 [Clostridia bacterium]|nr:hypothetical protein [Clostridia bacterium]MBR4726954.1 hypothetical protein [Clostridia bacterium]